MGFLQRSAELFLFPQRFFEALEIQRSELKIGLAAVLTGVAIFPFGIRRLGRHAYSLATQVQTHTPGEFLLFWAVHLLVGLALVGPALYWIGGMWYALRLRLCRAQPRDEVLARHVYCYALVVLALPWLLAKLLLSVELLGMPIPWLLWGNIRTVLFFVPFLSVWCSYTGVRTRFELKTAPAVVWFLVLPSLAYAGFLVWVYLR